MPSRQRAYQIANVSRGMCAYHSGRKIAPDSTTVCSECLERTSRQKGFKPAKVPRKKWDKLDLSKAGTTEAEMTRFAAKLGVGANTVRYQLQKRGLLVPKRRGT
jgi:hypothetical protein